jgi:hypothetical protein
LWCAFSSDPRVFAWRSLLTGFADVIVAHAMGLARARHGAKPWSACSCFLGCDFGCAVCDAWQFLLGVSRPPCAVPLLFCNCFLISSRGALVAIPIYLALFVSVLNLLNNRSAKYDRLHCRDLEAAVRTLFPVELSER